MSLADLLTQTPPAPWDVTGGYPQRVTNGETTLVAEVFDDPDRPPTTGSLVALAPDLAKLAIDMAGSVVREGVCLVCGSAVLHGEHLRSEPCPVAEPLARFAALNQRATT